jgi:hypothetical protein
MRTEVIENKVQYAKTTEGLRDLLFDEIQLLRAGKIDNTRARATANLARQIIESVRVQVQFKRVLNDSKKHTSLIGAK